MSICLSLESKILLGAGMIIKGIGATTQLDRHNCSIILEIF